MIKEYCDKCGEEISRNYVTNRLRFRKCEGNRFFGEIMVGRDMTMNQGAICFHCLREIIIKALNEE